MKIPVSALSLFAVASLAVQVPEPCLRRADLQVASLDPAIAESMSAGRAVALCWETLLQYDYEARPYRLVPYVAESMPEISEDGRTLTFRLRDDVFFGPDPCFKTPDSRRRMTAADVVYSLKRLADAKLSSSGYWTVRGRVAGINEFHEASKSAEPTDYDADVAGLRAVDERTLEIRLVEPSSEFLWFLAMGYCSIVPREAVEFYGARFGLHEAGSGPFTLSDWRKGHRMLFTRREGRDPARDRTPACEGEPYRAVELLVMGDASTKWLSFLDGTFDLATDVSRDDWDAVISPDGTLAPDLAARGVSLVSQPALESYYLGFNMDDPVVGGTNAALRRALSCAFDSNAWMALNRGRLSPSNGPIPPGVDGRLDTPHPYAFDLDRAKKLLAEAGYPDGIDPKTGRRLALILDLGRTDQETRESAELMASFFDKIGVSLSLSYSTFPQFLRKVGNREEQMFMVGWVADDPDALNFLQLFASENASPGPNRSNFSNAEFDGLFARVNSEQDPVRRGKMIARMQEIVREEVPWICLYYRNTIVLTGPRLRNFRLHDFPLGMEKHWRREE